MIKLDRKTSRRMTVKKVILNLKREPERISRIMIR